MLGLTVVPAGWLLVHSGQGQEFKYPGDVPGILVVIGEVKGLGMGVGDGAA